jgi:3-phosphoshikimate 1-carboxyvinyltransferase
VGTRIEGDLTLRCLDELPILAVAAAFAQGETVISDAAELRVKESDRIARMATGLRSLGVKVEEKPDGMIISGGNPNGPGVCDATGDHRIAMAFAVAGCATPDGVMVVGADAITSSYPSFAKDLEGLRGG